MEYSQPDDVGAASGDPVAWPWEASRWPGRMPGSGWTASSRASLWYSFMAESSRSRRPGWLPGW
jgi:hypothetical protein